MLMVTQCRARKDRRESFEARPRFSLLVKIASLLERFLRATFDPRGLGYVVTVAHMKAYDTVEHSVYSTDCTILVPVCWRLIRNWYRLK